MPSRRILRPTATLAAAAGLALVPAAVAPGDAEAAGRDVTRAQLTALFGSQVSTRSRVAANLPELNRRMRAAGITTPQRKAAFLATLVHESGLDPSASEWGSRARYRGRGYIQLTGLWNYRAAGRAIRVNLAGNPSAAANPSHSAAIATWYWSSLRPSNAAADRFDMGRVSRNVAYAASSREDAARCRDFRRAYKVLSGHNAPSSTRCYRH